MAKYLQSNLKYPPTAQEARISGRVYVEFLVNQDGSISQVKVIRSPDPSLEEEAIRVVKAMPNWIPGKQNGETVSVFFTIPINFILHNI